MPRQALTLLGASVLVLAASVLPDTASTAPVARAQAQAPDDIDFAKARQLLQRERKGEPLSADEKAYLDRAKAAYQRKQAQRKKPRGGPFVARESVGLTPLTDPKPAGPSQKQELGLYGHGRNQPPEAHLKAALEAARAVKPLNADGQPASDGKVGFISLGMSNTTQEFQKFLPLADQDPAKNPSVAIVDGAQGGMDSSAWANSGQGRRADPWAVLGQRLKKAGVSPEQVQVVWIKQARANPASLGAYPKHAEALKNDLAVIARTLKTRFPNLKLAYFSSRIYGGYASTPLNPEPYAYESAFSVRDLVLDQIGHKPGLNFDPERGEVQAPVLLWGPYLWADGTRGRASDDLVWTRRDLAGDGTHPSPSGQQKVAEMLLKFFKTDPTARIWFVQPEAEGQKR